MPLYPGFSQSFYAVKTLRQKNCRTQFFCQGSACVPFFAIFCNADFFSCQNVFFDNYSCFLMICREMKSILPHTPDMPKSTNKLIPCFSPQHLGGAWGEHAPTGHRRNKIIANCFRRQEAAVIMLQLKFLRSKNFHVKKRHGSRFLTTAVKYNFPANNRLQNIIFLSSQKPSKNVIPKNNF